MSPALTGAVLGAVAGVGLTLVAVGLPVARRPPLADRVLPYLHDLLPDRGPVPYGPDQRRSGAIGTVLEVWPT